MDPISIGVGAYALGTSLYNMYQNYKTRQREDNAVQRRVSDLQRAGLSPTLAAGSAASASATPQLNGNTIGAYLDASNAVEQLKQNREMTKQAKLQTDEMRRESNLSKMSYMYNLGFEPTDYVYNASSDNADDYIFYEPFDTHTNGKGTYWRGENFANSPLMQRLRGNQQIYNNELQESNLNLGLTQKENSWYNFNQGLNAVSNIVGLGLDAYSTVGTLGLKRKVANNNFLQFQQELNRRQNMDNWRQSNHGSYTRYGRGWSSTNYY